MTSHVCVVTVFVCCLLLNGVTITESFPNGAPVEACIYQTVPNHTGTKPSLPSTFLHEFVATRGSYVPGSTIHVHVSGPKIKGFFIQAIDDNYKPIGSFIKNDFSKLHDECSAITHTHPGPKKDLSFIWQAPQHGHGGNVYFRATILEEYDKYWSKVFAKVLRPSHF
ncbi:Reeler domain [Trinorchestia longiramus]|nr:Reeler domain [Trinorchestia longiramus]